MSEHTITIGGPMGEVDTQTVETRDLYGATVEMWRRFGARGRAMFLCREEPDSPPPPDYIRDAFEFAEDDARAQRNLGRDLTPAEARACALDYFAKARAELSGLTYPREPEAATQWLCAALYWLGRSKEDVCST